MIEDSEIKTTVSPFAIRPGEIKVFDGKDGYVSMNQIIQKINVGHINDLHFRIMEIVNEYEFITSRQLFKLLEKEKFEIKSQDKLNNKLEQLVKSKILTRYYFNSEDGKGIYPNSIPPCFTFGQLIFNSIAGILSNVTTVSAHFT